MAGRRIGHRRKYFPKELVFEVRKAPAIVLLLVLVLTFCGRAPGQTGVPGGSKAVAAVQLFVNGTAVAPESAPFIDANHRVQVPLRVIGEALGGRVTWVPEERRVVVNTEALVVEMTVGRRTYLVNGESRFMDTAPVVKSGRTFVPVRFLGEALQCRVDWDGGRVMIWAGRAPAPPAQLEPHQTAPRPPLSGFDPGAPSAAVLQAWGAPVRKDPGKYGFEWWVYHQDYTDYRQLGVRDGRVAVYYTNSPERDLRGVRVGDSRVDVERVFPITRTFRFHYQDAEFTVEQAEAQMKAAPLLLDGDRVVQLFFDVHREHRLTAFRTMDLSAFLAMRPGSFKLSYRYTVRVPDFDPPPVTPAQLEAVNRAKEQQIFDLANAVRQREGLALFSLDERVGEAARSHSEHMLKNGYFSHVSPAGHGPGDRLSRYGIKWRSCAENIALCPDAVTAHEAWLDSPGHRVNILSDSFLHLGVGVADLYYTQNFVLY